jgi:hypothetical protein
MDATVLSRRTAIRLEFLLHVLRQRPAGGFARGEKCRVMLPDEH